MDSEVTRIPAKQDVRVLPGVIVFVVIAVAGFALFAHQMETHPPEVTDVGQTTIVYQHLPQPSVSPSTAPTY